MPVCTFPRCTSGRNRLSYTHCRLCCGKSGTRECHTLHCGRNPRNEESKIRASSSELLGLYGLLRHFVETRHQTASDTAPGDRSTA